MKYSQLAVGVKFGCSFCNDGRIAEIKTSWAIDGIKVTCQCKSVFFFTRVEMGSDDMRVLVQLRSLEATIGG